MLINHNIGKIIDDAIEILEEEYQKQLKDVIPKIYTKVKLDNFDLAYLINIFTSINFGDDHKGKDITRLIVEILDIKGGRIFDPACGSEGFFVSALEKLEKESLDKNKLSIYGQESKPMPWKICKMNLALRGAEGDIRLGDSYHDDKFFDLRADYVVSNPPFNDSEWGADRVKEDDPRFKYCLPPNNNANYAWIQHFIYHLSPNGKAGFVMANGALSVGGQEGDIRTKIIKDDLIWGIIACPPKLFYNVSLPVSLWFLRKSKPRAYER